MIGDNPRNIMLTLLGGFFLKYIGTLLNDRNNDQSRNQYFTTYDEKNY